ncbi:hypothetical protein [Vibrio salinus]|uniref:hypothetical protein n=1 Tax=Vibrio salinus TaxID=2899784 RepID=UPI001E37324C|nr:hypothetical protein [Vibrio salinus]MCE0492434.1 hypothetical protein [Vibrio salinus]
MIKPYQYKFKDTNDANYVFECAGEFKYQIQMEEASMRVFFDDFGVSKDNELMLYQGVDVVAMIKISADVLTHFRSIIIKEMASGQTS